jgi:transcriptional regulator with XRE-family HTH domain
MARSATGTSQEAFELVSSRTYVSALERGLKQPTVPKVDALARVLGIHPMSLLALAYLAPNATSTDIDLLFITVREQVTQMIAIEVKPPPSTKSSPGRRDDRSTSE